jgi:hypothetical protein
MMGARGRTAADGGLYCYRGDRVLAISNTAPEIIPSNAYDAAITGAYCCCYYYWLAAGAGDGEGLVRCYCY